MPTKPLSIDQLRELINTGEAKDPLIFLESVMSGQDPRRMSSIYELIMEIDSFTNGDLAKEDWSEIVDHVMTNFKYHVVSMNESTSAAKTLAEYLHAKRKHIELSGQGGDSGVVNHPLTDDEIELFKEKFNEEF